MSNKKEVSLSLLILQKLSDARLTLLLLILLAIFSLPGTIIAQNIAPSKYITQFGDFWGNFIIKTNIRDSFNSSWFNLLLFALCVNLIACIITKIFRMFKSSFKTKIVLDSIKLDNSKNKISFTSSSNITEIQNKLKNVLGAFFNTISFKKDNDKTFFSAKTGQFSVIGSFILHIGILIIVAGGIVDKIAGDKTFIKLDKGQSQVIEGSDFSVKLNEFELVRAKNGSIKDFLSHLSIFEGNKKILDKTIEVNDPLKYKGIYFYQSSYGSSAGSSKNFLVHLKGLDGETLDTSIQFSKIGDTLEIKNGLKIFLKNFVSDFSIDKDSKQIISSSNNHRNPAIKLALIKNNKVLAEGWSFRNFPDFHGSSKLLLAGFTNYQSESSFYTVLQVSSDPGLLLKWIGIIMMSFGIIFVFYITPCSYSGYFVVIDGKVKCIISGRSSRLGKSIKDELEKIKIFMEDSKNV